MKHLPLLCAVLIPALFGSAARADVFVINFSGTVNQYTPNALSQPDFGLGSVVSGQIQIDLAQLPARKLYNANQAGYEYWLFGGLDNSFLGALPGVTMQVACGTETLRYDSSTLPMATGAMPGVFLQDQDGVDYLSVALRNGSRSLSLNLVDLSSPTLLVNGLSFPNAIDLTRQTYHPAGQDRGNLVWFDYASSQWLVEADITSVSFQIVPEPSAMVLLSMGTIGILVRRRHRR